MTAGSEPIPHAPWLLTGECLVAWLPRVSPAMVSLLGGLPAGVARLPGPCVLVGASYSVTPVGPYVELALAVPARLGLLRPGLCVVWQVVSSSAARAAYRSNWGLPAVVGRVSWSADFAGGRGGGFGSRVVRCEEPGVELRGAVVGSGVLPPVPMLLPMRSLQRRSDGPVLLPRRLFGLARLARTMVVLGGDPVAVALGLDGAGRVAGRHWGMLLSSIRMTALPARHPAGFWSSLRAPLQVAEPAMTVRPHPLESSSARALSSVG